MTGTPARARRAPTPWMWPITLMACTLMLAVALTHMNGALVYVQQ